MNASWSNDGLVFYLEGLGYMVDAHGRTYIAGKQEDLETNHPIALIKAPRSKRAK